MSKVYFVGCGPGDPDLITIKAKKLVQKADVIVYSGSLIPSEILKYNKKGKKHDAAKLVREEILDLLLKNSKKGKTVVRLHDGDPAIYGAIREQIDNLEKEGIESIVVPGVTSFLASAAALGTQLTLPGITQTMIITRAESRTKVPKREKISELAKHSEVLVFLKDGRYFDQVIELVRESGFPDDSIFAIGQDLGTDKEIIRKLRLGDVNDDTLTTKYFSILVIKRV